MTSLSKVSERDRLKPRPDPYWSKVSKGCFIGFRKMAAGSDGTWSARCRDEAAGRQIYKPLGDFSELPQHQRYDAAQQAATEWFRHLGKGGSAEALTVADACAKYVDQLRESKGDRAAKDVQARFNAYVLDSVRLANTELSKLTPAHLEAWRRALRSKPIASGARRGEQRTDSSLNRDMTCFRAALNLAYRDGLVTSDFAWRGKLLPIVGADRRREVYLDSEQRRKLIACLPSDAADLAQAMSLVPLRPGALAALTAASFDKRLETLTVGKDKAGADRRIALPGPTATFFASRCKDKLPGAPLLSRSNGKPWDKDAWKHPIKEAVALASLPSAATLYAIRHSVITDLIHAGVDTLTVAQLAGTSVLMIERHYGHLTQGRAREALAVLTL